jgi:hypothetical protein
MWVTMGVMEGTTMRVRWHGGEGSDGCGVLERPTCAGEEGSG